MLKEVDWESLMFAVVETMKFSFFYKCSYILVSDIIKFVETFIVLASDKMTDLVGSARFISCIFFVCFFSCALNLCEIVSNLEQYKHTKIGLLS